MFLWVLLYSCMTFFFLAANYYKCVKVRLLFINKYHFINMQIMNVFLGTNFRLLVGKKLFLFCILETLTGCSNLKLNFKFLQ